MLELVNISKSFGGKKVLNDFSFKFDNTGIYTVMGKSGIGKTTLLRIIAGLEKNFEGSIKNNAKKISFAFQEHRLFSHLTALENVTIVQDKNASSEIAKKLLNDMLINEEDFKLLPRELSGGMKQRISLARALLFQSEILLLDEPFKELDKATKASVINLIKNEGEKRLVIVVTHGEDDVKELEAKKISLE